NLQDTSIEATYFSGTYVDDDIYLPKKWKISDLLHPERGEPAKYNPNLDARLFYSENGKRKNVSARGYRDDSDSLGTLIEFVRTRPCFVGDEAIAADLIRRASADDDAGSFQGFKIFRDHVVFTGVTDEDHPDKRDVTIPRCK